jgi:molybdopterin-guanine dinucleotide biosynthesis protein A
VSQSVEIAGVILAGGRSKRFAGGRKEDALYLGRPLLDHVIDRARPQVGRLALSRGDPSPARGDGIEIIVDRLAGQGPLAGLHAGLIWASSLSPRPAFAATFACDTPLFPMDLVARLFQAAGKSGALATVVSCAGVLHPTLGLWSVDLAELAADRLKGRSRSLEGFAKAARATIAEFSPSEASAFFNVNTTGDLEALSRAGAATGSA